MIHEKVAILDAGSQYGKLIDRRVRELNVESHILPLSTTAKQLLQDDYKAIIISGGPANISSASSLASLQTPSSTPSPQSAAFTSRASPSLQIVNADNTSCPMDVTSDELMSPTVPMLVSSIGNGKLSHLGQPIKLSPNEHQEYDTNILHCGLPVLGICYGFHIINKEFHGTILRKQYREDGQFVIKVDTSSPLFKDLCSEQQALLTHGDSVEEVAVDFKPIAMSGNVIAAIANDQKKIYGVQFHPEVDLTTNGKTMLKNFLIGIANLSGSFTMKSREPECLENIRKTVKNDKVLVSTLLCNFRIAT